MRKFLTKRRNKKIEKKKKKKRKHKIITYVEYINKRWNIL